MKRRWTIPLAGTSVLIVAATLAVAADHNEADGTKADEIADIDDVYVWETADDKIVAVVTFGGPGADPAAPPGALDADVLYTISLDNDGDYVSDHDILVRFAEDSLGDWGVQFENVPGSTGTVSGAVGTEISVGAGLTATAGVFDDPFFFDFTGLTDTLATGAVSFDSTRDSFAGKNVNAIVVQMDAAAATNSNDVVRVWATTSRK
jgi:hypothetical protein